MPQWSQKPAALLTSQQHLCFLFSSGNTLLLAFMKFSPPGFCPISLDHPSLFTFQNHPTLLEVSPRPSLWAHLQSLGSLIHAMVSMTPRCWWLTRGIFPAQTSQTSCFRWFKGFSSTDGWGWTHDVCPEVLSSPTISCLREWYHRPPHKTGSLGLIHNTFLSMLTSKPPLPIPFTL